MMGMTKSSVGLMAALALSVTTAQAAYVNGFESAEYVDGTRLSSITDSVSGAKWTFGGAAPVAGTIDAIASTTHPASGANHIRLVDNSNSSALSAMLNLGSSAIPTSEFTITMKVSTAGLVAGSSNPIISLGESTPFGNTNSWFSISLASDVQRSIIITYRTASLGGSAVTFRAKQAANTNYQYTDGAYFGLSFTIDPTTYKYSSILVNGVEQLGLAGAAPANAYIAATTTPTSNFRFYSSGVAVGTIDIDDLSIAPVPEPASLGLMGLGSGLLLMRRR